MVRYRYHHLHVPQLHRQATTIDGLGLKSSGELYSIVVASGAGPAELAMIASRARVYQPSLSDLTEDAALSLGHVIMLG